MRWIKTGGLILGVGLIAFGLAWLSQSGRYRVERIPIDGHQIEFMRSGSGSPTVVFLHGGLGGGPGLMSWASWLPRVGTSAICYSRPGSGKSEPAKDQRTPAQIVSELHTLLDRIGAHPPYVLVGGSMGGLYSRAFAMMYPREVAGLVLVDGTHERQVIEFNRLDPVHNPLPPVAGRGPVKPEFASFASIMVSGRLDVGGSLPDVPMAIVTSLHHGKAPPSYEAAWRKLQTELFQSSTYGIQIVTAKSDHDIATQEPDLVLNAIRWVLAAARSGTATAAPNAAR